MARFPFNPNPNPKVDSACASYLAEEGLEGHVVFKWSTKTLVTTCGQGPKGIGVVNLVATEGYYRRHRLASLLDHEVLTLTLTLTLTLIGFVT